jgi:iron-siderophore transport system permease protein
VSATRVLRTPGDAISLRVRDRSVTVGAALLLTIAVFGVASVATGDYPLSVGEVLATLTGGGTPASEFIVETLRLPRVLTGLLVGGALGIAGAIFQGVARNPLGSPDVIGFTTGSATGALVVILAVQGSSTGIAAGSIAGGVLSAVAVYVLAWRRGVHGYRLVLVGIGVSAMLESVNTYLITRATRDDAFAAAHWLVGSLNGRGWEHVWPVSAALAVLVPVALLLTRQLALLEIGDEVASGLGVSVERSRIALIGVGVALTAVATASAGPIVFVALAAPQIARRLAGTAEPGLFLAALMGAALLLASDLLAQRAFGVDLPVGVVTGAVGGVYLGWLLWSGWRRRPG